MRHFILLLTILCILGCGESDSNNDIYEGDYTINDQSDIEFISKYKSITGNLIIEDTALTNIDGLENLTTIDGDIRIGRNNELTNINGLSKLTAVKGNFYIALNNKLINLVERSRCAAEKIKILYTS